MWRPKFLSHLGGRFGRGVFWNLLGTIFSQGSMFLTAIVLARVLGKEVFGEFGMIQSTLLTVTSIAQLATGVTATKYVAEFREADKERAGRVLGLCSVMTVATGIAATIMLLIGSPWLSEHVLAAPRLATSLGISAAFILFSVMNVYQVGALAGLESYKSITLYGAVLGVVHLVLCGLGALLWGLEGAVGGMAISALMRWTAYAAVLRREMDKQGIRINRHASLQEGRVLYKFALPAALTGLTSMPAIWMGNAFLVRQSDGYAQMGVYSAANNIRLLLLLLPVLLNNVGMSVLNNKFGSKDGEGYRGLFYANAKVTAVLAIGGAVVMMAFSSVIPGLYGMEQSSASDKLILILSLAIIPEALSVSLYQLIQTREKMWLSLFLVALPRDLTMIGLAALLIPLWGGIGWAAAYALGWLVAFAVIVFLVSHSISQQSFKP